MKSLLQSFGCSYLINLPERNDRLNGAIAELSRVGWDFGSQGVNVFPACKFTERAGFSNAGVRGAYHSHLGCLRRALAAHESVLILEDDIAFSPALGTLTHSLNSWLKSNEWDFVFFGHYKTGTIPNATSKTRLDDLQFVLWDGDIQGLHFYGVNERILGRLSAHLERLAGGLEGDQDNGPMPVDGAINRFRGSHPDVRTFIVQPKLGWQRPSRSDITPGKLDRFQFLRPLTAALRNLKHRTAAWR